MRKRKISFRNVFLIEFIYCADHARSFVRCCKSIVSYNFDKHLPFVFIVELRTLLLSALGKFKTYYLYFKMSI